MFDIETFRAGVRPFIAYTGWVTVLAVGVYLAVKFANKDIALIFIGILEGVIATIIGFYYRDRVANKK